MALTWIDNAIIGIMLVSVVISLLRGFVKEALSLVVWFLAFIVAARFSTTLSQLFANHIANESLRVGLSFTVLFVVTLIAGGFINFMVSELVIKTGLSGTNRLLGLIFGFIRGVVVVALLILLVQLTSIPSSDGWKNSVLVPKVEPVARWLQAFIPKSTRQYLNLKKLGEQQLSEKQQQLSAVINQQNKQ